MKILKNFDEFEPWSGAETTWEELEKYDRIDEFEMWLDEINDTEPMTETEINDILWHEPEKVFDAVGLYYNTYSGEVSDKPFYTLGDLIE